MFFGGLSLTLATLLAAGAGVDVRTTASCPTAQGISERLRPLLPAARDAGGERDVALVDVIEMRPDGSTDVLIRLLRPDTSEIGNRRVSLNGTCQDVAEAVAAILAAWETDTGSDETPAEEPAAPTAKRDEPVGVAVPASPATGWDLTVGAGAGVGFVGGVAANGMVELLLGREESHWQVRASASAQTARRLDMSPGHADWQHTSFAAGLLWRTLGPAWRLSLDAGPVLGWSTLAGSDFLPNRQQRTFEYGGAAGLRLGRTWGRFTLWAETRATLWLLNEQATAKNPVSHEVKTSDLPPVDATVSVGLSLALFP